ncbi:hypothetical protein LSH36_1023g02068 [Paralvinella palmiformis]|uniref:Hikeshi-like domain-containing protein n=1 Tax=Paralvinella palmiformis TaxID=53620 RepID=A0AAD9MS73_9ANNE|nr:hypothetical protein LSH36_1023g02068 [Paralvinella palmiformis]
MFGLIVVGRLVQTEFQQVSDHQVVFPIENAAGINHIMVFMTGQTPFPDGMGGAVYFCLPSAEGESWFFLGQITNNKPSVLFKVANLRTGSGDDKSSPFGVMPASQPNVAKMGISMEPLAQLAQMTPAANTSISKLDTFVEFSTKTLENFFNYASSFALTPSQMQPAHATQTFVPMNTLQNWFQIFQRRLQANPYFWRN